jgi:hypothetical protein
MVLVADGQPAAESPRTNGSLEVSVAQGYDTNPLELNDEALIPPFEVSGGGYTRVNLDARLSHTWAPRVGYFVATQGQRRFFGSELDEAESSVGRFEAGLGLVLFARGTRKLSASLSGSYGMDRTTFVDPATGKMYVTLADPNTLAPIPDRFDSNVSTVSLDLRLRVSPTLRFSLDSSVERQDYVEDYEEIPSLQSLDDRALTLRPGIRWQMSDKVRLDVTAEWNNRRYDELWALEEDATLSADTRRHYQTQGLRAAIRMAPSESLVFQLGLGGTDRQDIHAGYYDSTGYSMIGSAAWAVTPKTRLGLHVSWAVFRYERATLDFVPNGELRGVDMLRTAGSVERDLGGHFTMFTEGGYARSDNVDPLYDYRRTWAHAGVRYRL